MKVIQIVPTVAIAESARQDCLRKFDWEALKKKWWPNDNYRPDEAMHAYYATKFFVASILDLPANARIAEIGVRAGYSAHAFLQALDGAHYTGYDADNNRHGGRPGAIDWACRSLPAACSIHIGDTQTLTCLPHSYDFIHVDGDHSYNGALHDIVLSLGAAPYVLVDDYDFIPEVRRACDVVASLPHVRGIYVGDGGHRGNMLFHMGDEAELPLVVRSLIVANREPRSAKP